MSVDEDVKKLEHLCSAGGNVKLQSPIEHSMAVPQKLKTELLPSPGLYCFTHDIPINRGTNCWGKG